MEYLEDILSKEEMSDWEEKMKEPLKAVELSEDELEQLKREGRI